MSEAIYRDKQGNRYFVRGGFDANTGSMTYITFRKAQGGREQACSADFEWRETFADAQRDLDRLAVKKGWTSV